MLLIGTNVFTFYYVDSRIDRVTAEIEQVKTDTDMAFAASNDATMSSLLSLEVLVNNSVAAVRETNAIQDLGIQELNDKLLFIADDFSMQLALSANDFSSLVDDFLDAVVIVNTGQSVASGLIVHPDGYIVTNHHVVADTEEGTVKTHSKKTYDYDVIAVSPEKDLALLKTNTKRSFDWLPLASSKEVKVGTKVVALGSPLGLDFTVTEGIVSAVNRRSADGVDFVQIDVPVNPGNSGGPIVDISGNVIGITTSKIRGSEGIGFAVEADAVTSFVSDYITLPS